MGIEELFCILLFVRKLRKIYIWKSMKLYTYIKNVLYMYIYKVNIIRIRILIVNHTQSYGNYLTYEYLFYYNSFLVKYLFNIWISTY